MIERLPELDAAIKSLEKEADRQAIYARMRECGPLLQAVKDAQGEDKRVRCQAKLDEKERELRALAGTLGLVLPETMFWVER